MDTNGLMLSLLFGAIGTGFLMYGRRMSAFLPITVGLGLMVIPYFISNVIALLVVCLTLTAVPFVVRNP